MIGFVVEAAQYIVDTGQITGYVHLSQSGMILDTETKKRRGEECNRKKKMNVASDIDFIGETQHH